MIRFPTLGRSAVTERWFATGASLGALGVALGAFGAHGLKARVDASGIAIWETAARYHVIHALALIATGVGLRPLAGTFGERRRLALRRGDAAVFGKPLRADADRGARIRSDHPGRRLVLHRRLGASRLHGDSRLERGTLLFRNKAVSEELCKKRKCPLGRPSLLQEDAKDLAARGMAQLPKRLRFDLPDPLARDREVLTDLFQRVLATVSDAEPQLEDLFLAGRQCLQDRLGSGTSGPIESLPRPGRRRSGLR